MRDFFISYNQVDRAWAEWIAWVLEEEGYTTILQAWDFRPSENFVIKMNQAICESERTITILSPDYLNALYTQPEWAAAFAQDPTNEKGVLLPVRIRECDLKGLFNQIIYIDFVGKSEEETERSLLDGVRTGRSKPHSKPDFPGAMPRSVLEQPVFPGIQLHPLKKNRLKLLITLLVTLLIVTVVVIALLSLTWSEKHDESGWQLYAPTVWEKSFVVNGQSIAYASPDATHEIIRERLNEARESILIGMYDFTAIYVKDWLLSALERKVRISLLLNPGSMDSAEQNIINELRQRGADIIEYPTGRSSLLPLYHAKFIIIDRSWTLVQSANLTPNGVPQGMAGNRDTGVAVESRELAEFFTGLLEKDMAMARQAPDSGTDNRSLEREPIYIPYEPVNRFAALRISGLTSGGENTQNEAQTSAPYTGIRVLPVLTPENYLTVLPQVLASARTSIDIYQQYIRHRSPGVQQLLEAIKGAQKNNPGLKVRLILAKPPGEGESKYEYLRVLDDRYGWRIGANVRILNPRSGLNGTNKLVIVDRKVSLVGSANWSELGVSRSREACLLIYSGTIAEYYGKIFQADWDAGLSSLE